MVERWFDAARQRWLEVPGSRGGWACCAEGHGDAVVFQRATIPERAMAARLGERARPLRPDAIAGMSPVRIDGAQAVWLEGRGRDHNNHYRAIELWSAEVVEGPALANPRRVMTLPRRTMATPTFGGGVMAVPLETGDSSFVLVRLGASERLSLRPAAEQRIEQLLWITGDEVAVRAGPGEVRAEAPVVRRIPLASLPPWDSK